MEDMDNEPVIIPQPPQPPAQAICPMCHEPISPDYYIWQRNHKGESASLWLSEPNAKNIENVFYFCPNCGTKLAGGKPLSTSFLTQLWIYLFSIILPAMAFLGIKYWPGVQYLRSPDWEKKQIGIVAIILMAASTIALAWWGIVWFEGFVSASTGGLMGGMGNLGV
jgi:hypothetical protein